MTPKPRLLRLLPLAAAATAALASLALQPVQASSHREAPYITTQPKVDGTDFYLFGSYEPGRGDYVTVIANYQPLQAPYGGPNYFSMDPTRCTRSTSTTTATPRDLSFQFRFKTR